MLSNLQGAHHSQLPTCPSSLMEMHGNAEQKRENAKLKIPPAVNRGAKGLTSFSLPSFSLHRTNNQVKPSG